MKKIQFITIILIFACQEDKTEWALDTQSYRLGGIGAFSEVVNADIKQLALSAPMTELEMMRIFDLAKAKAADNSAEVWVDTNFLVTDLFDAVFTTGKHVLLIYKGDTKDRYLQLKTDKQKLIDDNLYNGEARKQIAWRMGKLLSYSDRRIEELLAEKNNL